MWTDPDDDKSNANKEKEAAEGDGGGGYAFHGKWSLATLKHVRMENTIEIP